MRPRARSAGLGLGLLLTLAAPVWASAVGWPTFKGDAARLGRGPALTTPIRQLWRVHLDGSLYSSPAIVGDRVLLGSSAKRVYCLDLKDGATRWQAELPDPVWGSSPALTSASVFVGCVDGCVHRLALADGRKKGRWCGQPRGFFGGGDDVLSSPLIAGGRLIFGSDDQVVYGEDLGGGPGWRFKTGGILHDNGACACGAVAYIPSRDGKLYALGLADGVERWSFARAKPFNTVPLCDGRWVWVGDGDGMLYCLSAAAGRPQWSFQAGHKGLMSSPALAADGTLVFGSTDGYIYALGSADGALRWKVLTGDMVLASPLVTGTLVWIGSYDGNFRVLSLANGHELWRAHFDGGVFTSAAVAGDKVVVAGRNGDVACFQATLP